MQKIRLREAGFSLVELLVTISVIGTMVAVAVPSISGITQGADATKSMNNARSIASAYSAAVSAGMRTDAATNLADAVDLIIGGTNITIAGTTMSFSVPNLTPEEREKAMAYLNFENGLVVFCSAN